MFVPLRRTASAVRHLFLVFTFISFAASANDDFTTDPCRTYLSAAPSIALTEFNSAKSHYLRLLQDNKNLLTPSETDQIQISNPTQELAFAAAVFETLGFQSDLLLSSPAEIERILTTSHVKLGDLSTGFSLKKLMRIYLRQRRNNNWTSISNCFSSPESESRRRIETLILKSRIYPRYLEMLSKTNLRSPAQRRTRSASPLLTRTTACLHYAFVIAMNALMVKAGVFIPFYPMTEPSEMIATDAHLVELVANKGWDAARAEVLPELMTGGRVDQVWRAGRKVYFASLMYLALTAIVEYSPYAWTAYTALYLGDAPMATYEAQHYNSDAIVKEQYQNWLESLDTPPTKAEEQKALARIKKMEAAGEFKIYQH